MRWQPAKLRVSSTWGVGQFFHSEVGMQVGQTMSLRLMGFPGIGLELAGSSPGRSFRMAFLHLFAC